jgi:nucleoid-associated protein YgaU
VSLPSVIPTSAAPTSTGLTSTNPASASPTSTGLPSTGLTSTNPTSPGSAASASSASIDADLLPGWLPQRPAASRQSPKPAAHRSEDATPSRSPETKASRSSRSTRAVPSTPGRETKPDLDEFVVRRGDTLWDITARHLGPSATDGEIAAEWPHWFTANRAVIGNDPDRLRPGERLRPPDAHHGEQAKRASQ